MDFLYSRVCFSNSRIAHQCSQISCNQHLCMTLASLSVTQQYRHIDTCAPPCWEEASQHIFE